MCRKCLKILSPATNEPITITAVKQGKTWPLFEPSPVGTKCSWRGTAPMCRPDGCPEAGVEVARDRSGDGSNCWTGEKILCCSNDKVIDDAFPEGIRRLGSR